MLAIGRLGREACDGAEAEGDTNQRAKASAIATDENKA